MRKIAWFLIIISVLSAIAEPLGLKLPTVSWAFNTCYNTDFLMATFGEGESAYKFAWFGYLVSLVGIAVAVFLLIEFPKGKELLPTTKRRIQRFKDNTRGMVSLVIIAVMVFLASLDQLVVGKKALYVSYQGQTYCPAFMRTVLYGKDLGVTGDMAGAEVNYRKLKKRFEEEGSGTVIMPLIPYDPTQDTAKVPAKKLKTNEGKLLDEKGNPLDGRAATLYDDDSERQKLIYEYREGVRQGRVEGRDEKGGRIYEAYYDKGELVEGSQRFSGEGMTMEEYLSSGDNTLYKVFFHAAPPMPSSGHLLGTTGKGSDLAAYLYGGLQVNIRAALIYIPAIYLIGITFGLLMGFFGGWFDLIFQRIIEIFSTIPFLFVVIIFSSLVPSNNRGLMMILLILVAFGWMSMTYLMRTAALREKARDYVAAARVSGASTNRIIFSHILPNTVAILVTLVPFSVSGIIMSLTALDYLGFGLPPEYATWGTLLKEGLNSFSKPWLVTSAFTVLVSTLILVTFVGEAVRDAFDPKKFTTYK
ncbi:microcin C transport system permease protein [Rubritalea squalenifaciens DSM 18772]|uniref:Microcin C transport system permease protein n=1 Tax=Rubritalea squalenifaciens DSM 18772 TaxID=1123071 RepID=A0A1M6M593_9BACT|nr:ABC transporter permease subunit [Rubritalea squalenifaciens]SHJ78641.1 microcin C transport system permease protein [Rubritalea squalenifaciens DSM 18772]